MVAQSPVQRRLTSRILPVPGLNHVPHDAFVHDVGIDARASDRFADDEGSELGRREWLQRSEKLAGRRANGGDDDGAVDRVGRRERWDEAIGALPCVISCSC